MNIENGILSNVSTNYIQFRHGIVSGCILSNEQTKCENSKIHFDIKCKVPLRFHPFCFRDTKQKFKN